MESLIYIPFLVVMVVFALLYLKGKAKYAAFVSALDKETFGLRDFFPVGFMAMELSGYKYASNLDRTLRRQLAELYTAEYQEFYLRVIWAQAVTNALIGLLMGTLFFAAMGGDPLMLVVGAALGGVLAWAAFSDVKNRVEKRHLLVAVDLPDLTNQIIILSGAGLTIRAALLKISAEMPASGPLYQALAKTTGSMEHGATDEEALDQLTVACNMPQVRRFVSVILQNMHRGGADVLVALQDIGKELWEARKAAARQIAEETSTKLLFPMMLMLIAVILLVAAPAVMGMAI